MEKTTANILFIVFVFASIGVFFVWNTLTENRYGSKKFNRFILMFGLVCFVYVLVKITLIGRPSVLPRQAWLIPFYSYYKYLTGYQLYLFKQDLQNVLLFLPFGFLGNVMLEKWSARYRNICMVSCGFFLSLSVEILQYIKAIGLFEIDDIIHNVLGTVLGCILYEVISCLHINRERSGFLEVKKEKEKMFVKAIKSLCILVGIYLLIFAIGYIIHLYYVYVVWQ